MTRFIEKEKINMCLFQTFRKFDLFLQIHLNQNLSCYLLAVAN